ncbi:hypothetical protein [Clostridium sp.]|uniref:hypothetical protein n=1 Tax=Clostridium sp. TaxID=1506 RepID=UPI0026DC369F|nr:hypothetical protein [Clostridium sp.]MDO5038629.1 hypothetical protein [Clostridium sp.]
MINKKRKLVVIITVILVLIFNSLIYFFYDSLNNKINENNEMKNDIKILNDLKDEVIKMAHSEKLWIATGKDEYKYKFEDEIITVNTKLDNLYNNGKIDINAKIELKKSVEKYKNLSYELSRKESNGVITKEQEKAILELNDLQINILKNLTVAISGVDKALNESNNLILNSSENQKNFLQIVSCFIGVIVSAISYIFNKKTPKEQIDSTVKVLDCIFDEENNKDKNKEPTNNESNKEITLVNNNNNNNKVIPGNKYKEIIYKLEEIYKVIIKYENDLEEAKVNLGKIEIIIKYLKEKIENQDCKKEDEKYYIKDLEYEFDRLNKLISSLEAYYTLIREEVNGIKRD